MSKAELSASVIVAAFSSEAAAQAAFDQIKGAKKELGLRDAAIVQRDGDKVHVKETKDMGGGKGAVIGGVLAGIATGGLSILGGALLGGIFAKGHDANLANKADEGIGCGAAGRLRRPSRGRRDVSRRCDRHAADGRRHRHHSQPGRGHGRTPDGGCRRSASG